MNLSLIFILLFVKFNQNDCKAIEEGVVREDSTDSSLSDTNEKGTKDSLIERKDTVSKRTPETKKRDCCGDDDGGECEKCHSCHCHHGDEGCHGCCEHCHEHDDDHGHHDDHHHHDHGYEFYEEWGEEGGHHDQCCGHHGCEDCHHHEHDHNNEHGCCHHNCCHHHEGEGDQRR